MGPSSCRANRQKEKYGLLQFRELESSSSSLCTGVAVHGADTLSGSATAVHSAHAAFRPGVLNLNIQTSTSDF